MCEIRKAYDDSENLITALHYSLSLNNQQYQNILPPLVPLSQEKQKELLNKLKKLDFFPESSIAA